MTITAKKQWCEVSVKCSRLMAERAMESQNRRYEEVARAYHDMMAEAMKGRDPREVETWIF